MSRINFEEIPEQLMACMMTTEKYVSSLKIINESLMELIRYQVSVINQCAYCIDMHFKEGLAAGESEIRLYSVPVWRETKFYNDTEQALLAWAEAVTKLDESDEQRQRLFVALSQYFSKVEIANLTLSIMQINSWNRLARSFGFEAGSYQVGQH